jgi:hypothetical protein
MWEKGVDLVRGSLVDRVQRLALRENTSERLHCSFEVLQHVCTDPHETKQIKRPTIVSVFDELLGGG